MCDAPTIATECFGRNRSARKWRKIVRLHHTLRYFLCLSLTLQIWAAPALAATQTAVTVAIDPMSVSLSVNSTKQFAAKVTGSTNQAVPWSVNNIVGGTAPLGTINSTGLSTAPAVPPAGW